MAMARKEVFMPEYYPVDSEEVRKNGMRGVVSTGAGIGIVVFNSLLHLPVIGIVISGALIALGVMGLVGKNRTDKTSGTVLMAAGGLGVASIFLKGLTGFLFGVGGVGLIGYGVFNLIKFAKGLKSKY